MRQRTSENKPKDEVEKAKYVLPEDIRNVIVSYFCYPRLFLFPENYELLEKRNFQLSMDEIRRMQFIEYFKPNVEIIEKAFAKTQGIQARGEFLYFNEARNFTRTDFELERYALLFGPFPKRFSAMQLQKVVKIGGKKQVAYSICLERQCNCMLFAIFPNNFIKNEVKKLKAVKDSTYMNSDEFENASKRIREILKSDEPVGGKEAMMAWNVVHCFECNAEATRAAIDAISRKPK